MKHKKLPLKSPDEVDVPLTLGEKLAKGAQEAYEEAKARGLDENACGEAKRRYYRRRPGPRANRVGRPPKGPAALRPKPDDYNNDSDDPAPTLVPDIILRGDTLEIMERIRRKPGEGAMAYLERVSPTLIEELVLMAMSPTTQIHPRIKLDIIKELVSRPLPTKQYIDVHSSIESAVDRMTDEEVYAEITQRLKDLKQKKLIPASFKIPEGEDEDTVH